jgi:hypothetical protein
VTGAAGAAGEKASEERTMNTAELENQIIRMADDVPTERLLEAGDKIARLKELVREVDALWQQKMIQRIEADGPIQDGDILYRVGNPPKTTCRDLPAAVEAVLVNVGGDFQRFCEHLASGALKHGACKATLPPDEYDRLFLVEREAELQKDEATPRRLAKVHLAFVRRPAAPALTK